ncbi:MAG: 3D domain-containing protein [Defluviitaleaceae bacterium]|nr:3D domain-containing protein [Defluviitaleaceae bacterium]
MVKLLRVSAFVLVVLLVTAITRPYVGASTLDSEPNVYVVTLIYNGVSTRHRTTAHTVAAFLTEQEIEIGPYDAVIPHIRNRLEDRRIIEINRAFYTNVLVDGVRNQIITVPGKTAGEMLESMQTSTELALLFDGDKGKVLNEEIILEFSTWRSEIEHITKEISYATEYIDNPSLYEGTEYIRQKGMVGEHRFKYEVIFVANVEQTRERLSEYTIYPTTQLIYRGTKSTAVIIETTLELFALGALTDTGSPHFQYVRQLTMNASAYTAGFSCTGKRPGHPAYRITASGREVEHGIVAVDPRVIPLGTRLYVEGYGFAIAADTGSGIRGYMIDLFMEDIQDARRFGRRNITVFVLE